MYINPADYLDGPEPYYYVEDDDGTIDDGYFDAKDKAIAAATVESGIYSDVYRVYESGCGQDDRVIALVFDGKVYQPR